MAECEVCHCAIWRIDRCTLRRHASRVSLWWLRNHDKWYLLAQPRLRLGKHSPSRNQPWACSFVTVDFRAKILGNYLPRIASNIFTTRKSHSTHIDRSWHVKRTWKSVNYMNPSFCWDFFGWWICIRWRNSYFLGKDLEFYDTSKMPDMRHHVYGILLVLQGSTRCSSRCCSSADWDA